MAWWPFGKKKNKEEEVPVDDGSFRISDDEIDFSVFGRHDEPEKTPESGSHPEIAAEKTEEEAHVFSTVNNDIPEAESAPAFFVQSSVSEEEQPEVQNIAADLEAQPAAAEPISSETAAEEETTAEEEAADEESSAEETTAEEEPVKKGFFGLFKKKEEPAEPKDDGTDTEEDTEKEEVSEEPEKPKKKGFFARLKEGLAKTRDNFVYSLDIIFDGAATIDDDFYEELEEILIMGDIGVRTTEEILDTLKDQVDRQHIVRPTECKKLLIKDIRDQMAVGNASYEFEKKQSVVFVIGVNGVGKTTSIGKIASHLKASGKKVMMAAADTFRAAAGDQLKVWAERAGVELIGGREGADPSSVLYDATAAAKARGVDVLLVDTAGRLNNKKNLMEELKKMNRVIDKEFPQAHRENLIVLDATTGQNALQQARDFNDVADLSGIILTKMDGTAKGGIAVAIQSELKVPVKYIGVGEHIEDLQKFDADAFVEALFDVELEKDEEDSDIKENDES
ncbi:MAG: signal recognition particle-docking protein FtsY [Lachnospiraceae bacterium]|nr:signal recognition particle-docking protein FtsY [Lachnospiraceae bacterium]